MLLESDMPAQSWHTCVIVVSFDNSGPCMQPTDMLPCSVMDHAANNFASAG